MRIPFLHRLSVQVVAGAVLLLVTLFGAYSWFTVRHYNEQTMHQILASAGRMSDVIKQSMHQSMLLDRKDDVLHTISMIGTGAGVEGIRIYNKRGEIIFSTDKREERSTVDMHGEACYACHDQEKPLESLPGPSRTRIYTSPKGFRVLGLINPIRNEPACSNGPCHAHPPDKTVLGVLDVRMSLAEIDAGLQRTQESTVTVAILMSAAVALITLVFLTSTVLRPVRLLTRGAQEITSGNLNHRIAIKGNNELSMLARTFNEMSSSLSQEREKNRQWGETLQQRVLEKTDELNAVHKQILHIEKMASLGKLAATVAHELNNPLGAILTYSKLIARRLRKEDNPALAPNLQDIEFITRETDRCGTIVKNLLLFSKKQVGEFAITPLRQIVDRAVNLVQHHCQISKVTLTVTGIGSDTAILCDENQIQQALVALLVNAVEAMPGGGTITVSAFEQPGTDETGLRISDTGLGIRQEDLAHIFEPFFTTKKDGRGVGLGLSVVFGIVERHNGRISVSSEPGKGTTFTLFLPRTAKALQPDRQKSSPATA